MPARLDIYLQRNEDWSRSLYVTADGSPIDLTGMTAAMQIRDKITQTLIATGDCQIIDGPGGEILATVKGSVDPLSSYGAAIQTVNLHQDIRLTDTDGFQFVLWSGLLVLSRGETQ